jgi:hypothetical protein
MRARGRPPNTAVKRSRVVATRRSISPPSPVRMQNWLSRLWRSSPIVSMAAGLPAVPCGVDRVTPGGAEHCHRVASATSRFITTQLEALDSCAAELGSRPGRVAKSPQLPRSRCASLPVSAEESFPTKRIRRSLLPPERKMTRTFRQFMFALGALPIASLAAAQRPLDVPSFMTLCRQSLAGDAIAVHNLGYVFGKGLGVRLSPPQAYKWFHAAALLAGASELTAVAMRNRDLAGQHMRPEARRALQEEAAGWVGELRRQLVMRALAQLDSTRAPGRVTRSDVYARHKIADVKCSPRGDIVSCRTVDSYTIEPTSCAELMLEAVFWPC